MLTLYMSYASQVHINTSAFFRLTNCKLIKPRRRAAHVKWKKWVGLSGDVSSCRYSKHQCKSLVSCSPALFTGGKEGLFFFFLDVFCGITFFNTSLGVESIDIALIHHWWLTFIMMLSPAL